MASSEKTNKMICRIGFLKIINGDADEVCESNPGRIS